MVGNRGKGLAVIRPGDGTPRGPFILAVPGVESPIMDVTLPEGVHGEARRRIARQQIADRIGVPPDGIVVCPFDAAGGAAWTRVIVMDAQTLERWSAEAGKACRAVVPDYLLLPAEPERLSVDLRDGCVVARIGDADGFSAPVGVAARIMARALAPLELRSALVGHNVPGEVVAVIEGAGLDVRQGADVFPANLYQAEAPCDLRQAVAASGAPEGFGLWATAAALALLAFAVWAASVFMETRAIERQRLALAAETESVLRQGLVPSGPLLDVRTQVSRRLADLEPQGRERDDLIALGLLSRVTVAVFGKGFEVTSIVVNDQSLSLDLTGPDFESAEVLASDLSSAGLENRVDTLRARDSGGVEARFTVLPRTEEDR